MTDKQLVKFASQFRKGMLGKNPSQWMCFAVSAPLQALLQTHGIEAILTEVDLGECNHIFLTLPDGRVLDPTADQFNWCSKDPLPPVYLGEPCAIHHAA